MKTTLVIIFSFLGIITTQAQTPTFEETLDYIIKNTKGRVMYPGDLDAYSRVEGYHLTDVKINRNGKIELVTNQQNKSYGYNNNFSIVFNIFDLVEKVDYPDGIRAHKFLVHFNGLNVSSGYGIAFATDADAQKVARAFRYLKTLCVKEDDLFSKKTDEEKKPKLSREETIVYINNLLFTIKQSRTHLKQIKKNGAEDFIVFYPEQTLQYNSQLKTFNIRYKVTEISVRPNRDGNNGFEDHSSEWKSFDKVIIGTKITFNLKKDDDNYYSLIMNTKNANVYFYGLGLLDEKTISRLQKAFLRLSELEQDNVDPFDN